jgi:formylglycine-generating enzyme required for sulfatase activity
MKQIFSAMQRRSAVLIIPCLLLPILHVGCRKQPTLTPLPQPAPVEHVVQEGMVKLPGGEFMMGTSGLFQTEYGPKEFPEEKPQHKVRVNGFWIDETEVTNAQFAAFVKATNYVTYAERDAKPEDFPQEALESLPPFPFKQGSIVFIPQSNTKGDPNAPGQYLNWWKWDTDANWLAPMGKGSNIDGKENFPVVCVTYEDAAAYAKWAGKRLPTEAEWEYASRGGLVQTLYVWGDKPMPDGKPMCNSWQGEFPNENTTADGFAFSSPVKSYAANRFGLYDMAGNVWEICSDFYDPVYFQVSPSENPQGPETWVNRDSGEKSSGMPHRVTKGGSFLCHDSYCFRYRSGARHSQDSQSPTNHTGFRCVKDL